MITVLATVLGLVGVADTGVVADVTGLTLSSLQFPALPWCTSWVWQMWLMMSLAYLYHDHGLLPCPNADHGASKCG